MNNVRQCPNKNVNHPNVSVEGRETRDTGELGSDTDRDRPGGGAERVCDAGNMLVLCRDNNEY